PHVNLGEQLRSPWIERVVQIKNPAADMREFAGIGCVYHARISSEITLILLAAERYINYPLPSGRQERFMKQIIVKASINTFVSIAASVSICAMVLAWMGSRLDSFAIVLSAVCPLVLAFPLSFYTHR